MFASRVTFHVEQNFLWSSVEKTLTESCSPCLQAMKRLNGKTEDFLCLWSVWLQANLIQKQYVLN